MLKRKFSFHLTRMPSKSDVRNAKPADNPTPKTNVKTNDKTNVKTNVKTSPKANPEPASSHAQNHHHRHTSKDSITTANSPYICRRPPLDPQTERELRIACKLILQNFKPSDHGFADVDPKLDFQGMSRRREYKDHRNGAAEVRVRAPTGAPADSRSAHEARKHTRKNEALTATATEPSSTQANTGRRRAQHTEPASKTLESRRTGKPSTSDVSRSGTMRTDLDSDDGKSLGTPLTSSTGAHVRSGSSAPTSAALASEISSKRQSRQFENAAAVADAQASEWMRQELERKRLEQPSQCDEKSSAPPPTRSKSVRAGIKDIFSGSHSLSRAQSHASMRTASSKTSSQSGLNRSGSTSARGWRSWGLQRASSSRSSSRPGTSKGRLENQDFDKKSVNLNRELPPLPSLDSWKSKEQQQNNTGIQKSQIAGAHIATVMRSPDQQQQEYAAAVRRHRRSGSDTLALRYGNSAFAHSSPQIARSASKSQANPRPGSAAQGHDRATDCNNFVSTTDSIKDAARHQRLASSTHSQPSQPAIDSPVQSPGRKSEADTHRHMPAPNFSRKISSDVSRSLRGNDREDDAYSYVVRVASQQDERKTDTKSVFKKVFSGWMAKKEKKEGWMDKLERNGVKGGVMVQEGATVPPVVKY